MGTAFDNRHSVELGMPLTEMQFVQPAGHQTDADHRCRHQDSADVCGLEDEPGIIEKGTLADIILDISNPQDNLNLFKIRVVMVMYGGVIILDELE